MAFSQTDAAAHGAPVVLELFISEGCSSCPPADALLSELGSSNKSVIPLAYHVDYWNHLVVRPFLVTSMVRAAKRVCSSDEFERRLHAADRNWRCLAVRRFLPPKLCSPVAAGRSASSLSRGSLRTILGTAEPQILQVKVDVQIAHRGNRAACADASDL